MRCVDASRSSRSASADRPAAINSEYRSGVRTFHQRRPLWCECAAQPNPRLDQVEETLTDGYACALQLETERLRLQRRLEASAFRLAERPPGAE